MKAIDLAFARNFSARYAYLVAGVRGFIEGGLLAWSSTTAVTVSACKIAINGRLYETTGTTTLTSGSTMKDMSNSTVTIGASKCYFVIAYNNAGTLEFRVQDRNGSGDGADPTYDNELDYWKAASTGAEARRVGKFWTNGSSQIIRFKLIEIAGRTRRYDATHAAIALVSNGTATSFTSVTITPYVTADDDSFVLMIAPGSSLGAETQSTGVSIDSGTSAFRYCVIAPATSSSNYSAPYVIPNSGTLHYTGQNGNSLSSLYLVGHVHRV